LDSYFEKWNKFNALAVKYGDDELEDAFSEKESKIASKYDPEQKFDGRSWESDLLNSLPSSKKESFLKDMNNNVDSYIKKLEFLNKLG